MAAPHARRVLALLALAALPVVPLIAPAPVSAQATAQASSEAERLERYVPAMLDRYWQRNPTGAIAAGYYAVADRLAVPDEASREAMRRFLQDELRMLAGFDEARLSDAQRLDLRLMRRRFEGELWAIETLKEWQWQPSRYNVAGTIAHQLDTAYAPVDTRLRQVMQRLAQVPAYYAAAERSIAQPTLEHTVLAIEQNRGGLATVFGARIERMLDASTLPAEEKQRFRARLADSRRAIEGYLRFLGELRARLEKEGARSFRIGKALYGQKFAHEIQSGFTAEQLVARARAEKARLHDEMERLSRQLWPKVIGAEAPPADRLKLIGRVIDELGKRHVKPEEFVDAVRAQIPALERFVREKDLLDQDPSRPLVVREMPEHQRGTAGANIQSPGPYDATAATYYNVTPPTSYPPELAESFLREYNHWMLQWLNIHEAIPGHYTQLVHSNKSASLVKTLFRNGSMIEGWAVYGEKMMLEAGYGGGEPELALIWMKWNLRSVCNTILDYEIHAGEMDEKQLMTLLVDEAFQSQTEAMGKWRRARLTSVQLTSYYNGYAEILALREEQKARLGKDFALKAFHNRFLSYGSVPVKEIAALMNAPR